VDFEFPEDVRMFRETVAHFVQSELLPLEKLVIKREAERGLTDAPLLPAEVEAGLKQKAKAIGLWGIDVPEKYGGQNLGYVAKCAVWEQLRYSIVPFVLPPDSPNLYLLMETCRGRQIQEYLEPYARGEKTSCIAITEPGAGSDAAGIKTRAERKNGKWILSGSKIFITNARRADFMIVFAVTDPAKGARGGISAFVVDAGSPGVSIPSSFPMIAEYAPYAVYLDNVEVGDEQVLGEVGQGFAPMQDRLSVRRMELAARSLGMAKRCLDMMIGQAKQRSTFGVPLADRQTIQWWIADSYQEIEMCRLLMYRMAWRMDQGKKDFRLDGSMVKLQATEAVQRVADRAIQLFGGMGLTKELPLEYIFRVSRIYRIVEGASEIHRWTLARELLKNGIPAE
jgi:(R)-benzylsuccinyl-CoA dehydrogenase